MPRKKKGLFEPIGKPAPPLTVADCARCGVSCMVRVQEQPLQTGEVSLRAATTTRGMCRECAAHWWIFSVDGLRWALEAAPDGPGILQFPNVQSALNNVLGMMHPELAGCDWARMEAQWSLPWPDDWALPKDEVFA